MTLQQEAYQRIDQMTDDGIRVLIDMIDKMKTVSVIGFKDSEVSAPASPTDTTLTKDEKKKRFLQSAGKIAIDAAAIDELRARSMI